MKPDIDSIRAAWERGRAAVAVGQQPDPVDTAGIIVRVPTLLDYVAKLEAKDAAQAATIAGLTAELAAARSTNRKLEKRAAVDKCAAYMIKLAPT